MSYSLNDNKIGIPDFSTIAVAGAVGAPGIKSLPSVTTAANLGEIREGFDSTNGEGKFIFLSVPTSTTTTAGLLYQWDKNYLVTVIPAKSSSQNSGVPVACAINSVASNTTSVQYTWFQVQGTAVVLKTAVTISPQSKIYMSATAGRIYATASAGGQILGARSQNTATVTSTTSTLLVYLNFSDMEGA